MTALNRFFSLAVELPRSFFLVASLFRAKGILDELIAGMLPRSFRQLQHVVKITSMRSCIDPQARNKPNIPWELGSSDYRTVKRPWSSISAVLQPPDGSSAPMCNIGRMALIHWIRP